MSVRGQEGGGDSDGLDFALHPRANPYLFGHESSERLLLDAYRGEKLPHAILLTGAEGIGKATLAWRLARFVLSFPDAKSDFVQRAQNLAVDESQRAVHLIKARVHPNLFVLRREYNEKAKKFFTEIRVEEVRRLIKMFQLAAGEGKWRVCIIDSAGDLNRSGANALLKVIEEPPLNCLFLIIAHRAMDVLPTIGSRCQRIHLQALDDLSLAESLKAQPNYRPDWLPNALKFAEGSPRRALWQIGDQSGSPMGLLQQVLGQLPNPSQILVSNLADQLSTADAQDYFERFIEALFVWLDQRLKFCAAQKLPLSRLNKVAQIYQELRAQISQSEALNLDRRVLVVTCIDQLTQV